MNGNSYGSIDKSSGFEETHRLLFPSAFHQEPPFNFLILLRAPAIAWNPFWITNGDSLPSGRSSVDDSTTRNLAQFVLVLQKRSLSESVSESVSFPIVVFFFFFFFGAVMFRLFRYALSPPTTESNKAMYTSGTLAIVYHGSKRNILR